MPNIPIRKVAEAEILPRQLQEEMRSFAERIRTRAYELFLKRGGAEGRDLDDWLQAERETMPETQLAERDREYQARINVSGIEPKEFEIIVTRNFILLQSPRDSRILQRLELPKAIDPDRVTAKLDRGILQVIAPKGIQGKLTASQAG
jgi:HSP20 family molecular chaperone IbpA